ncbi:MAG: ABC transporter ATP-binding protein [Planctomycetota bacterium]
MSDISYRFGPTRVLEGLNLTVHDGEYLVLLGASGCGKTTLLRIIGGFARPESGVVRFGDADVTRQPPRNRDVAYVPQSDGLYPHLSIRQSMELGLADRVKKYERLDRIRLAAKLVEIDALLERRPDQLSGGQLRRAAVAKAIARRASVRLLDEPLSALDAQLRFRVEEDLRRLHQSYPGVTIHVTHDGREAMRLADRIAVISDGKIAQIDSSGQVFKCPCSPEVAAALGASPFRTLDLKRVAGGWQTATGAIVEGPHAEKAEEKCIVGYYEQDARDLEDEAVCQSLPLGKGRGVPITELRWFFDQRTS